MDFKVHLAEMDFKVHLDLVRMIFMDSYIGAVHLAKMDFVVKMHPTFVT